MFYDGEVNIIGKNTNCKIINFRQVTLCYTTKDSTIFIKNS